MRMSRSPTFTTRYPSRSIAWSRPLVFRSPTAVGLSEKLPLSSSRIGVFGNFSLIWLTTQARRARPPEGFVLHPQGSI